MACSAIVFWRNKKGPHRRKNKSSCREEVRRLVHSMKEFFHGRLCNSRFVVHSWRFYVCQLSDGFVKKKLSAVRISVMFRRVYSVPLNRIKARRQRFGNLIAYEIDRTAACIIEVKLKRRWRQYSFIVRNISLFLYVFDWKWFCSRKTTRLAYGYRKVSSHVVHYTGDAADCVVIVHIDRS